MKPTFLAIFTLILIGLPIMSLVALGVLWLWQHDGFLVWLLALLALPLTGLVLVKLQAKGNTAFLSNKPEVQASPFWTDTNLAAWQQVLALAESADVADYRVDEPADLLALGRRTLSSVADFYHPESKNAVFEIALPYLLFIIQRVSEDMRQLLNNVPFSHVLTIQDVVRGRDLATFASRAYKAYRFASVAINPVNALLRELSIAATQTIYRFPAHEVKLWLLRSYVKKVGFYAIELYSGGICLDDSATENFLSRYSASDLDQPAELKISEPLRVLVLGQVNAGKSSLINALFGELRAATDIIPTTSEITPYLLQRDGLEQMIILDSAGYSATEGTTLAASLGEIKRSDLIVLVCAANTAARSADRQMLERISHLFREQPDRLAPALVVVLSYIDTLRPHAEWNPPYDVVQPEAPKAKLIRKAMDAVAQDLSIEVSDVVPVCLKQDRLYNLDEGLIPAILTKLGHAKRARFIRCLREQQSEDYWSRLRLQALNAGTLIYKAGLGITKQHFGKSE